MSFSISDNYRDGVKPEDIDSYIEEEGVMEMNEQEIIEYLKQNKEKGVAFGFMPEEAKHWCGFHSPAKIFKVFDGFWSDSCYVDCFSAKNIYCLSEDYEPEPEFKGHYEEFDIDIDGSFVEKTSNGCFKRSYYWWDWAEFLNHNHDKYNDFGGWLFNDKLWSTKVLMTDIAERELYGSVAKDKTVVPVTPTKIKFWRYKE